MTFYCMSTYIKHIVIIIHTTPVYICVCVCVVVVCLLLLLLLFVYHRATITRISYYKLTQYTIRHNDIENLFFERDLHNTHTKPWLSL